MKFSPLHASLMTLALFAAAAPGHAAAPDAEAPMVLAQAETDAAPQEFEQIRKFLAAGKDLSQLSDERLQQRLSRAQRFQKVDGLPEDLAQELQQEVAALTAEIERRQQAAAQEPAPQPEAQAEPPPQPEAQPEPDQQAQTEAQPQRKKSKPYIEEPPLPEAETGDVQQQQPEAQPAAGSPEAAAFLETVRPAADLDQDAIREQMRQATELARSDNLSPEQRTALRGVIREGRAALKAGETAATPEQPPVTAQPEPQQQVQPQPEAQPSAGSPEAAAFLQSVRPAAELDQDALREQMRQATELARSENLSPEQRDALRGVIREARAALKAGETAATPEQPPVTAQPEVQQQVQQQPQPQPEAQPTVDPEAEKQAQAFLADTVDVRTMSREDLRKRLSAIRDLLATNALSLETREALRKKLAEERQVLRAEVKAKEEGEPPPQQAGQPPQPDQQQQQQAGQQQPPQQGGGSSVTSNNVIINNNTSVTNTNTNTDVRVVLGDQRPPQELDDQELVRRIDVYRDVVRDERYSDEERRAWRRQLERDRRYLRRQMLEERQAREERLRSGDIEFNIDIGERYDPNADVPDDVFAAEVEDDELADVLAAPPRRKVERRYTVEEIERNPQARNAVARIEIDTVHFGFGEGFLREEEIGKLDRIAQVLEKILAKNPEEVFLLEGHTDAVGSDAANLQLSRQRALAVKEALTTYYVIPADNLKTVGLGERYLKIPTQQPEAENRRVSLARITPLVGRAD